MTLVKICGITHADDVDAAVNAGADRLGFVVEYPLPVPWNLSIDRAAELMARVPEHVTTVAVVGGNADTLLEIARRTRPSMMQLHADEPPDVVEAVAASGIPALKALRAHTGEPIGDAPTWIASARRFVDAGASEILLDSHSAERPAGTGHAFDWRIAAAVVAAIDVPVVLAGGLTPGNVAQAVATVRPACVDVITGVSADGDRKSPGLMQAFVRSAHSAPV